METDDIERIPAHFIDRRAARSFQQHADKCGGKSVPACPSKNSVAAAATIAQTAIEEPVDISFYNCIEFFDRQAGADVPE